MGLDLLNRLDSIDPASFGSLSDEQLLALAQDLLAVQAYDRQINQLRYYLPVSLKAVQVHTTKAKVLGVGGGNGACLPLHAPVLMADGTWRPLGEIAVGDMVMAADPITREAVPARVTNTFRSGVKEVFRVTFSDGGSFEATREHHVPVMVMPETPTPTKRSIWDWSEMIWGQWPVTIAAVSIAPRGQMRPVRDIALSGHYECGDLEVDHPAHCYITGDYVIVSNSKTDTSLVEMVIRATGQIPQSLRDVYPRDKLRGPINCRVVVESITNTLETIILPKLQWWKWQGVDEPGGPRGHYGWIPKHCLLKGEWDESWTSRTRTLEVVYRDPDTDEPRGLSRIQFMSYDQDPSDFASGDFHFVLHDEPPKESIWIENMVRVKRVNGTIMMAMTWPDDPTTPVDWIIDRVYEPAQPGKNRDPTYEWINMYATDNQNLDQTAVAELFKSLTAAERATRIYGQHLRLSNRVHPLLTDVDHIWCFPCNDLTIVDEAGHCGTCGQDDTVVFNHVQGVLANPNYPVICAIDPHPRKPHMLIWVQVDPNDDLGQVAELEVQGSPQEVADRVFELEADYGWQHVRRLIDPNMGRSPSGTDRETTWQDSFERVGLSFDLADDSDVGRQLVNDYLKPDATTRRPRCAIDPRNLRTIYQMKRFSWDDYKKSIEKDQKQRPKQKNDDYPALWRYIVNSNPTFRGCRDLGQAIAVTSGRRNGY